MQVHESLFNRLLATCPGNVPTENFFTGLVAHLFTTRPQLLFQWLASFGFKYTEHETSYRLETQAYFPGEDRESHIPDLSIELSVGAHRDHVLVESKIGSSEGKNQLWRYAQCLAGSPSTRNRVLIYITRDYEPKEKAVILEGTTGGVSFFQTRWCNFYQFLKAQPTDVLNEEVLKFMEAQRMNQPTMLEPEDSLAMFSLKNVLNFMQASLDQSLEDSFTAITGVPPAGNMMNELLTRGRFINSQCFKETELWIGYGYWFDRSLGIEEPQLRLQIEVAPFSKKRTDVLQAFKSIVLLDDWHSYNLDVPAAWSGVYLKRDMKEIRDNLDHLTAATECFADFLKQLGSLKIKHLFLPGNQFSNGLDYQDKSGSVALEKT
jgi:PD-(D/E)XK nuclease superfamily